MPKIVFQHKQQTPPPAPVAPTKSSKPRRLSAPPPITPPSPTPTQVVRSKPVVQAPSPVIEEKPTPVPETPKTIETPKPVPVIQTPVEEPETIVETTVKEYNTSDKKQRVYQTETVVSTSDDDWGIMQVTKKKSAKEISKSVQQTVQSTTGNAVVLDGSGVALLIETIVTELGKQFVRKDEVIDLVTLALQKMVMEDVKPKQ